MSTRYDELTEILGIGSAGTPSSTPAVDEQKQTSRRDELYSLLGESTPPTPDTAASGASTTKRDTVLETQTQGASSAGSQAATPQSDAPTAPLTQGSLAGEGRSAEQIQQEISDSRKRLAQLQSDAAYILTAEPGAELGRQMDTERARIKALNKELDALKTPNTNAERDSLIQRMNAITENEGYATTVELADAVTQEKQDTRQRLHQLDEELGNAARFYDSGERAGAVVKGALKQTGSAYTNFMGTLQGLGNRLHESSSTADQAVAGSDYAGWATDELTAANMAEAIMKENPDGNYLEGLQKEEQRLYEKADTMSESAARDIEQAKEGLSALGKAGVDISTNLIQMGIDAAGRAAGLGMLPFFVRAAGGSMQEARHAGASTGQQLAYGLTKAAIEVGTEKLFDGLAGVFGKGAADDVIEGLIGKLSGSNTGRSLLRAFAGAAGEGTEEVISDLLDPLAKLIYNDRALKEAWENRAELRSQMLYDYLLGAAMGGFGSVTGAVTGQYAEKNAALTGMETQEQPGAEAQAAEQAETPTAQTQEKSYPTVEELIQPIRPAGNAGAEAFAPAAGGNAPVDAGVQASAQGQTAGQQVMTQEEQAQKEADWWASREKEAEKAYEDAKKRYEEALNEGNADETDFLSSPEMRKVLMDMAKKDLEDVRNRRIPSPFSTVATEAETATQQEAQAQAAETAQNAQRVTPQAETPPATVNAAQAASDALNLRDEGNVSSSDYDTQRRESLMFSEAPQEAVHNTDSFDAVTANDDFQNRDFNDVGNRKIKAYMYENPEVKPFFQFEAEAMLSDLKNSVKGERFYNSQLAYDSGNEYGWTGNKRLVSDDIAVLLDYGYSYEEIEKGLKAIIEDDGRENNACSKRIEFLLNDRLMDGYTDWQSNEFVPPNQEYRNMILEKQINAYSKEAFEEYLKNAERYAPKEPKTNSNGQLNTQAETNAQEQEITAAQNAAPAADNQTTGQREQADGADAVRGFSKNVATDSAMEAALREDVAANPDLYKRLSNKETLQKAQDIFTQGLDTARTELERAIGAAQSGQKFPPEMVPLSRMVANELTRQGELTAARKIISDVAAELTGAGQLGQAGAILRNADPITVMNTLQKTLDSINKEVSGKQGTSRNRKAADSTGAELEGAVKDAAGKLAENEEIRNAVKREIDRSRSGKGKGGEKQGAQTSLKDSIAEAINVGAFESEYAENAAGQLTEKAIKELGTTVEKIALGNSAEKTSIRDAVVSLFVSNYGLSQEQAFEIADLVTSQFDNMVGQAADRIIERRFGAKPGREAQKTDTVQKLIEAVNTGAFNTAYATEAANKLFGLDKIKAGNWKAELTAEEIKQISETDFSQDGAYEAIQQQIAARLGREMPATLAEKLREIRKVGMLANPKTQVKNRWGNIPLKYERKMAEKLSGGLQELAVKAGIMSKEEQTRTLRVSQQSKDLAKSVYENNIDRINRKGNKGELRGILKDTRTYFNKGLLQKGIEKVTGHQLNDAALDYVRRFTYDMLEKGDAPFVKSAFIDSLAQYCEAQGIKAESDVTETAISYAIDQAMAATFKDASAFAKQLNSIKDNAGIAGEALDVLLPFTTTPINIAKEFSKYSPLGYLYLLNAKGKGNAEVIDIISRATTGSAVVALGILLRSLGAITGAADDDKDKAAADKAAGISPYSILGKYSYEWMQPTGSALAMGASIYDAAKDGSSLIETLSNGIISAGDAYLDQSFYKDIIDLFKGYGSPTENMIKEVLTGTASQFIPTIVGATARTIDPTVRTSYSGGNIIDDILAQAKVKTPGLSKSAPASVNVRGEETQRGNLGERIWDNFIAPWNTNRNGEEKNAVDQALDEVYTETGDKTIFRQVSPYKVDYGGETYKMTGEEREQFQKTQGQVHDDILQQIIDGTLWQEMDNDAKVKTMQLANEYALDAAKRELVESRGGEYTSDWDDEAELPDVGDYLAAKTTLKAAQDSKDYTLLDALVDTVTEQKKDVQEKLNKDFSMLDELIYGKENGVDAKTIYVAKGNADVNGNGSITQEEMWDYLGLQKTMPTRTKSVLWDILTSGKTGFSDYAEKHK